jgi:protein-tyrosine-phosphatase
VSRFRRHVFVCQNERAPDDPRGCCAAKASAEVLERLKAAIHARGLKKEIRINKAGCLDQCALGVSIVVYPEGVWYGRVRPEDVDEIVEQHLVGGRPVERLRTDLVRRVVFLCVENSFRSQIAEAFARLHGGPRIEALSAGSKASGTVHPRAVETMKEVGIDLTTHRSKGLAEIPDLVYDAAVTMGCGECPVVRAKRRIDWAIPDPKELSAGELRRVRDEIEHRVKELLSQI